MENNVNNNVANNTNVATGSVQPSVSSTSVETVQPVVSPATASTAVNPTVANTTVSPATSTVANAAPINTVAATASVVPPVNTTSVNNGKNNNETQLYYKKFYIMMGILVGSVLLIAGILLFFLLNGTIENRNRLTCTKTTQEDGYTYHVKRYYTFDRKVMQRIYYTHTFTYNDEFTEDMYNQTYDDIINNENNGITNYGFNTKISKECNFITITAYDINYYNDTLDTIKESNAMEAYTCE